MIESNHIAKKKILQKILIVSTEEEIDETLLKCKVKGYLCTKKIGQKDLKFKCPDCMTLTDHCICSQCFYDGNHNNHFFMYYNNSSAGVCDCGDRTYQPYIKCKEHYEISEGDEKQEIGIISENHIEQIESYFRKEFERVFSEFDISQLTKDSFNNKIQIEETENEILSRNLEEEKQEEDSLVSWNIVEEKKKRQSSGTQALTQLLEDINIFISDNLDGCKIISRVMMQTTTNFKTHHFCSAILQEDYLFYALSKNKMRECSCSILKNIFRYISCYDNNLENSILETLNHLSIIQEFKQQLIVEYVDMIFFLLEDYCENSELFKIQYQFQNELIFHQYCTLIGQKEGLAHLLKQLIDCKSFTEFQKAKPKLKCFSQIFFLTGIKYFDPKYYKGSFENDLDLPILIIKSTCQFIRANNYGVSFIVERLTLENSFLYCVKEMLKFVFLLPENSMLNITGKLLEVVLDQIVQFQIIDEKKQIDLQKFSNCVQLESEIYQIMIEHSENQEVVNYVNTKLNNFTIQSSEISLANMNCYESELLTHLQKLKEILSNKRGGENQNFSSIEVEKKNKLIKIFSFSHKSPKLTELIPFSEKNQCPLFNNQYRILALIFSQFYLKFETIQQAKQQIFSLLSNKYQLIFEDVLLFTINQLSSNFEYLRQQEERIMGYNDYQALYQGLPGRNSDLVAIENYYTNLQTCLYDVDILTMQTILPLVDTDKFFQTLLNGFQVSHLSIGEIFHSPKLMLKRLTCALKWVFIIFNDTSAFLNSYSYHKLENYKCLQGYLDQKLNICFQFNTTYTLTSLKDQLQNLNLSKKVEIKHRLLQFSKIVDDKFQRLEGLPFIFDPMTFLRQKKLHNSYYQILKEAEKNNPEIEFIVGNQFLQTVESSSLSREIANQICSSTILRQIFMKILANSILLKVDSSNLDMISYSLKYFSMILQLQSKDRYNSQLQLQPFFETENQIWICLNKLREDKELEKSISKIDQMWRVQKQSCSMNNFNESEVQMENENTSKQNSIQDEKETFSRRSREAQMKSLKLMQQKQQNFLKANEESISQSVEIQGTKNLCVYCQDPDNKSLEVFPAFIERDNLDLYSNRSGKIPKGLKYKYIIQSCTHNSHFDCFQQIQLREPFNQLYLVPHEANSFRRMYEGNCLQCRQLFNIGIPILEPFLRQSIQFSKANEISEESSCSNNDCDIFQIKYESKTDQINNWAEILISTGLLTNDLLNNFEENQTQFKVRILQECLSFILEEVYEFGLVLFFKKTKQTSINLFLAGRVYLNYILLSNLKQEAFLYMKNIINKNLLILTDLNKFSNLFINYDDDCIELHSYQELQLMFIQTVIYMALTPETDEQQTQIATQIVKLSQTVFKYAIACFSSVIISKSFPEKKQDDNLLQNSEFVESLEYYIQPWKNLIIALLLSLYSLPGEKQLQDLFDQGKYQDDSLLRAEQLNIVPFLKVTSEMFELSFQLLCKEEILNPSPFQGDIKCLESSKFNFVELGQNFKQNYIKYFYQKCLICHSYPQAALSHLHLCLICGEQLCSISCQKIDISALHFDKTNFTGNLINHSTEKHEGKSIFINLSECRIIYIDSPMAISDDHLYFDCIKTPFKMDLNNLFNNQWDQFLLDNQKLQKVKNLLINRQLPNTLRSLIKSSSNCIISHCLI